MKTPNFWRKKTLLSIILTPFSLIYWLGFKILWILAKKRKFDIKVICVGNLTAGGAGKTPVAIAIGKILKEKKVNFAYLSSGYKGVSGDFCEVKEDSSYREVGDEPLLLNQIAPTFVTNDRVKAIKRLEKKGFDLVVLDDGMQDGRVEKDFLVVVIDGKIKFGNGLLIPAGPLRSRVARGLKIANRIVVVGGADQDLMAKIEDCRSASKLISAKVNSNNIEKFKDRKILAFCGIGYPEKFFDFLIQEKVNLVKKKSFADHYSYQDKDLDSLIKIAKEGDLRLLTTKKDWVKFPKKYREKIYFLDINFVFKDEKVIIADIEKIITKND